jgi:tetratricopeptide (TPR) repeat protein
MKRRTVEKLAGTVLMAAVLVVFSQVAWHDFIVFDDGLYITSNSHVQSGLTIKSIRWSFTSMEASNWHPLTWLSHMLDYELYGLNPAGHHLTSLFFHVANTLLLFLLLRGATGRLWESAAVAALFGLHPLHIESVAWVSERKDVLSTFFWMLTTLAYVDYCRRPGLGRYALILISFGMGLVAKPMLVTLPFVLLLLDFWPLGRLRLPGRLGGNEGIVRPLKRLLWEKTPLFLLSAASSMVTFVAQSKGGAISTFEALSLKVRIINAFVSYARYLERMFWPHDLAIFYPHPNNSLPLWQGVAAALLLVMVSVLVGRQNSQRPFLPVGWLWFLGTLVPVIGIVQVGGQSMADRYTYIPSIGIFLMCVWGVSDLLARVRHRKPLLACGGTIILLFLSLTTWLQLGHWQDSETLFRHALSVTKRNYVAHHNLGTAFIAEDRLDEAVGQYKKALDIWSAYPDAHNNLGVVFARQGLLEKAISHYKEALRANPKHILAHQNIANALAERGCLDEAVSHYSKALNIDPDSGANHNAMGVALARLNRPEEAVSHLTRAIDICPDCPEPYNNLGRVLTMQGKFEEAVSHLQSAITLRPDYAEAYNNLGLIFVELGELEQAVYYFAAALHHKPDYTKARHNLRRVIRLISEALGDENTSLQGLGIPHSGKSERE